MYKEDQSRSANQTDLNDNIENFFNQKHFFDIVKYAISRIYKAFRFKYDMNKGIDGFMLEDIIQKVTHSFLNKNGRKWYIDKFPDFKDQFYSALDSEISNIISSKLERSNKKTKIIDDLLSDSHSNYDYDQLLEIVINRLEELGASDEELLIFEPYIIHKMKRDDIAKLLNVSNNHMTNLKKKLLRKLVIVRKELKNNQQFL